jgi:CubicO group peptidase (beta-lactamase class C family)
MIRKPHLYWILAVFSICFSTYCFTGSFFSVLPNGSGKVFPGNEWLKKTPESQGIDSAKLQKAINYLSTRIDRTGSYTGGLMIVRNGYCVWWNMDSYTTFTTSSVSKSFLSTGLGLMIEDGKITLSTLVKNFDQRIGKYYPNAAIRHFVTMTSGYDGKPIASFDPGYDCDREGKCDSWDPGIPQEPLFTPGTKFRYWDEAEMELSYALGLGGGNSNYVKDLLQERIATPIGMENFTWRNLETTVGPLPAMNGGLKTTARDLARFGLLFLNRGNWNGKQLIKSAWVDEATSVQVPNSIPNDSTDRGIGSGAYGYNWWVNGITPSGKRFMPGADPGTYWAAGYGSNRCFVIPAWNMVIVRTGEQPTDWAGADSTFSNFLNMVGKSIIK